MKKVLWFLGGLLLTGCLFAQSSVTIDQVPPYKIDQIFTFTSIFPSEARSGGRTPQFEFHPRIQVTCSQNGEPVHGNCSVDPEGAGHKHNGDGTWTGYSDPMGLVISGLDMTQPANCLALLWNPTQKQGVTIYTLYATTTFDVEP